MAAWALVADSRKAKLFDNATGRDALVEIADFIHALSSESRGDKPSRPIFAGGSGTRHGLEGRRSEHEREQHAFAAELARYLCDEFKQQHFSEITLVAAPEFLGVLRGELGDTLKHPVVYSINKDLTSCSEQTLQQHLRDIRLH